MASSKTVTDPWSALDGFLGREWPSIVSKGKKTSKRLDLGAVTSAFQLWGLDVPDELRLVFEPLAGRETPPLRELTLGSHAPLPPKKGNTAAARLLAAQDYRPLWVEIFGACVEIGSTLSGDIWMYTVSWNPEQAAQVYLYSHEEDAIGVPQAANLEAFVFRAALCGAHESGAIDDKAFRNARKLLANRVAMDYFAKPLKGIAAYEAEDVDAYWTCLRGAWIATVLTETDPSDAEIRRSFDPEAGPEITEDAVTKRGGVMATYAPSAFYFGLASFLTSNDAALAKVIGFAKGSKAPLIRDLALLLQELRDGRKDLGKIRDMQALRARVTKLSLWSPPGMTVAPLEGNARKAFDLAVRDSHLEAFAWEHASDPSAIAAVEEEWQKDPVLRGSVDLVRRMRKPDGYRDEDVSKRYVAEGDRRTLPLLVARALHAPDSAGPIAFSVLVDVADERTIPLLAAKTTTVNRFHSERFAFTRLVHAAGTRAHAPLLVDILRRFPPKKEDDEYTAMLDANVVLALGDLGATDAVPALLPLARSTIREIGSETPIALDSAVLYALGELGAREIFPALMKRAMTDAIYDEDLAGLRWALGCLARNEDASTREKVVARLRAVRISERSISDGRGKVSKRSIRSLFDERMSQVGDIAAEIALERSLVVLGGDDAPLKELVSKVLREWPRRSTEGNWSGYRSYTMLAWALLALRHHPEIGVALARPFLTSDAPLASTLARLVLL